MTDDALEADLRRVAALADPPPALGLHPSRLPPHTASAPKSWRRGWGGSVWVIALFAATCWLLWLAMLVALAAGFGEAINPVLGIPVPAALLTWAAREMRRDQLDWEVTR